MVVFTNKKFDDAIMGFSRDKKKLILAHDFAFDLEYHNPFEFFADFLRLVLALNIYVVEKKQKAENYTHTLLEITELIWDFSDKYAEDNPVLYEISQFGVIVSDNTVAKFMIDVRLIFT